MSRKIRFRAWDIENKRFVNIVRIIFDQFGVLDYAEVVYKGKIYKLYPSEIILEQYTGLKDKNGKEICDGDILESEEDYEIYDERVLYVVYYNDKRIAFNLKKYGNQFFISESGSEEYESKISFLGETEDYEKEEILNTNYIKVIGNIHRNQELLGGGK